VGEVQCKLIREVACREEQQLSEWVVQEGESEGEPVNERVSE
jgi:hypothetical protein